VNGVQTPQPGSWYADRLAGAALALYPAAWRARYGDEVRVLLEDSGVDVRSIASLVWRAVPAWIWPARHLYDRPARMRASLATVLVAWTVSAGLAVVFVWLTQAQPTLQAVTLSGHPVIRWSYWVFDGAIVVSVLAFAVGGVPLWWRMLRTARRGHRRRDLAYLLSPLVVSVAYVTVVGVVVQFVRHPAAVRVYPRLNAVIDLANGNIGRWWFLALVVLGFAAAGGCTVGPGLALRRLRPHGRPVRVAVHMGAVDVTSTGVPTRRLIRVGAYGLRGEGREVAEAGLSPQDRDVVGDGAVAGGHRDR
jgi:hypothetical protein